MKLLTAWRHSKHQALLLPTKGQYSPRADVGEKKTNPNQTKQKVGLSWMNFEEDIDVVLHGAFPTQTKLTDFPG